MSSSTASTVRKMKPLPRTLRVASLSATGRLTHKKLKVRRRKFGHLLHDQPDIPETTDAPPRPTTVPPKRKSYSEKRRTSQEAWAKQRHRILTSFVDAQHMPATTAVCSVKDCQDTVTCCCTDCGSSVYYCTVHAVREHQRKLHVPSFWKTPSPKRMRIDAPTGPSAYNLYCRDISKEEDMKAIPCKEKFREFSTRWSALDEEERAVYFDKASTYTLSGEERDRKWRANERKMLRLMEYQKALKPTTEGFIVMSHTPGLESCTGTEAGLKYLQEHEHFVREFVTSPAIWAPRQETVQVTVKQIRELFNSLYTTAVGAKVKMPYKDLKAVNITGLPDGLDLRNPSRYGNAQLQKIWAFRDKLSLTVCEEV